MRRGFALAAKKSGLSWLACWRVRFHHSKHYPSFLRYVVNETLDGHGGHLKERALGVEVFGRGADYDTNADPVVRTSACEVRKRIAQYYHEPGHEEEIRIDLPSGSYIPEFRYPATAARPLTLVEAPAAPPAPVTLPDTLREWIARKRMPLAIGTALAVIAGAGSAFWMARGPSSIEKFWNPVWHSTDSVLVGLGTPPVKFPSPADPPIAEGDLTFGDVMRADNLALADALAMARIMGVSREYAKKKLDVRRSTAYTLTDLRKGPIILIGAFNNPWAMRLTKDLRFHFERGENHLGLIVDRENRNNRSWAHDPNLLYSTVTQDYAVVSRFFNPLTEEMTVAIGGTGRDGTVAAGEFVTEPRYLDMLAARAPRNWEKKNLQVVLATDIVRGNTGPPRILATYFW